MCIIPSSAAYGESGVPYPQPHAQIWFCKRKMQVNYHEIKDCVKSSGIWIIMQAPVKLTLPGLDVVNGRCWGSGSVVFPTIWQMQQAWFHLWHCGRLLQRHPQGEPPESHFVQQLSVFSFGCPFQWLGPFNFFFVRWKMPEALTATACLKRLRMNLSEDVAKRKPRKKNVTIAGAQSGLDDEIGAAPKGLNVSFWTNR